MDRIFAFHGDKARPDFNIDGLETIYVPWPETEMYRTFYPLLGEPYNREDRRELPAITQKSLLIVDEMLMIRHRNTLRYNCMHHFLRVSGRRIVFNYLPFIDDASDYMILLDYAQPDHYKMQTFDPSMTEGVHAVRHVPDLSRIDIETTAEDVTAYETRRDALFDSLGQRDPDTIPRNLILQAGKIKARHLRDGKWYVARNHRIKSPRIVTYADTIPDTAACILDPTYKRRDLIDFIRRSGITDLDYMMTSLPVDKVYYDDLTAWIERLGMFYDAADIH